MSTKTKKSKKTTKTTKTANAKRAAKPKGVRSDSKTAKVVDLLKRANGVTLEELVDATGWKANSVRGFISGTIGKKMGLKVESTKGEDGKRKYQIASLTAWIVSSVSAAGFRLGGFFYCRSSGFNPISDSRSKATATNGGDNSIA